MCLGAVGAKANVLQSIGFVRWDAALLILLKRWHFVFHFSVRLLSVVSSFRVRHNVLQLGEVAEIEAQMFSFAQKFNRRTAVEFSTKPAILPNCCCAFALIFCRSCCHINVNK